MAEEVHGTIQGGNGERLEVKLGSKSVGIAAQSLIPILLLLSGLVGGYIIYINVMDAIRASVRLIYQRQEQLIKLLDEQTDSIHKMLLTHEWNMGRDPGERLPLDLPPHHSPLAPVPSEPHGR
jgi:hypothetical protein